MEQLKTEYFTFDEWLAQDGNVRTELYEGSLIMLAPPNQRHQSILMELAAQLHAFVKGKRC